MSERRRRRLGEQLRREISEKVAKELRDPGIGSLTVTGVDVTKDLWLARVFVAVYGSERQKEDTLAALRRSAPYLRSTLSRELHIRRMPELRFHRDTSASAGRRIEAILRDVGYPGDEESQG